MNEEELEKEAEEKLSEEEYKLAEEVIKPIYHNAIKNDYSFAKYGVDCYRAGYNKANEWHYVKDGVLPEDNKIVLFYTTYFDFWIGGIEPKNDKKHRWEVFPRVSGDYYAEDEVIAWKEIVLPKE